MKDLSSIKNPKQEMAKLVEKVKAAEFYVNSASISSVNFIAIKTAGGPPVIDAWMVENPEDARSHIHIQAFGNKHCGELVVSNIPTQNRILLFGSGKKFDGSALFVQKIEGIYTILYHRDKDGKKDCFRLTSTRDEHIVQIILFLIQDEFQDADVHTIEDALSLLVTSEAVDDHE